MGEAGQWKQKLFVAVGDAELPPIWKPRGVTLGGGGCFAALTQSGYMMAIRPFIADTQRFVVSSSGGSWFYSTYNIKIKSASIQQEFIPDYEALMALDSP